MARDFNLILQDHQKTKQYAKHQERIVSTRYCIDNQRI
jgi:hypothetical protein